jgi:3D (Asp-Asp-Asp) domain-containing protein
MILLDITFKLNGIINPKLIKRKSKRMGFTISILLKKMFLIASVFMAMSTAIAFWHTTIANTAIKTQNTLTSGAWNEKRELHNEKQSIDRTKAEPEIFIETFDRSQPEMEYIGQFEVTWYTLAECGKNPGDKDYGITSSGKHVQTNLTIASDIMLLPYGTRLYIPSQGLYEVMDTGSAIKENRLDIYTDNLDEALSNGRQLLDVFLIRE